MIRKALSKMPYHLPVFKPHSRHLADLFAVGSIIQNARFA